MSILLDSWSAHYTALWGALKLSTKQYPLESIAGVRQQKTLDWRSICPLLYFSWLIYFCRTGAPLTTCSGGAPAIHFVQLTAWARQIMCLKRRSIHPLYYKWMSILVDCWSAHCTQRCAPAVHFTLNNPRWTSAARQKMSLERPLC